ncbi:MAG: potassium transporter [Gammaproteobacteria bacterium]|nr:potassium transporter [Gammaproteobacteria bacterium]
MQSRLIFKVLGFLIIMFSVSLLPPLLIGWYDRDATVQVFLQSWGGLLLLGVLMWFPNRKKLDELRIRDGFLIVVLFWVVLALSGALPFILSGHPQMSVVDAVFESMSGLTTTGATVLIGLDDLPRSILYYRQQLQWLGGMGIIVLAVAIAPVLGVGGMQLFRAETPGPMKNNKLTPRITETAKALWLVYFGLTVVAALLFYLAGMSLFDAIGHSFSTMATGGFSTHDASIAYFNSPLIDGIAMLFMLIAGINFSLHYLAIHHRSLRHYLFDSEVKAYLLILFVLSLITISLLIREGTFTDTLSAVRYGLFQVISFATTTGYTSTGFSYWPGLLPVLLIIGSFVGGCAGSTGGGMKVIRVELLIRQGRREIDRLLHPNAVLPIKLNKRPVSDTVINAVWGFFALYVISFVSLGLLMMMTGSDIVTAFSAIAATLNNLGPGLGEVTENYRSISDAGKWILSFTMLLGRLELFSLLVVLTPAFWKR